MSGLTLKGVSNFEVRRPNFRPNRFGARGHFTPNFLIGPLAARSVHTNRRAQCDENIISAIHFVYLAEITGTGLIRQRGMC